MLQITFTFAGGPHDGKHAAGRLGDGTDADRYYHLTNHGTVGFLFKVASPYAVETLAREGLASSRQLRFQKHFYVVAGREQDDAQVRIRAEYVPNAAMAVKDA